MTMNKIRIGKDIKIRWCVNVDDRPIADSDNLKLVLINPRLQPLILDYVIEDGVIIAYFRASEQKYIGNYKLTLWFNYGETNQTALDVEDVFKLVTNTSDEILEDDVTDVTVDITGNCVIAGQSAYELWLELGNEGTKEDFINSLKAGVDETVLQEMQNKLNILYKVTLTFNADIKAKKGTSVRTVLKWTVKVNGTDVNPISQSINGVPIEDVTVREYTVRDITKNTSYTLLVDGVKKTCNILFYNPVYYGAVADTYEISNDVTGLKELTTYGTRASTITAAAQGSMKFVYLYPSAFGALTSIKDGNNFTITNDFTKVTDLSINGESYIGYILKKEANINGLKFIFS